MCDGSPAPPRSYPSDKMAQKLWNTLEECNETGGHSRTFGALGPVQAVTMAPKLTSIFPTLKTIPPELVCDG